MKPPMKTKSRITYLKAPITHRPDQCSKILGVLARKLGLRDHLSKIGQPFLRSVRLAPVSQIWAGCFRSPLETTGPELVPQNKHPTPKRKKTKRAAQRRLLDQFCSQQERGEPKGSSAETARLVLVPPETGKTNSSSPETARPVLVTQPKGKTINP